MTELNPTILVVEDELMLLEAITKKVKLMERKVVSCSSGQQALDYLAEVDTLDLPDAIWLDFYLPDMDGLEFMQRVRRDPKCANIPVVIVSNSADPDKVKATTALGVKRYVLKSEYRLDEIVTIIDGFINRPDQATKGSAAAHD